MKKDSLKKGIIIILITNLINMFFKVFINFVQPKFLSVETYANLQTYTLYCSYLALLHFGYVDGMYLKYGGKKYVYSDGLAKNASTLRVQQLCITAVVLVIAFWSKDINLIVSAFSIIPLNVAAYFRMLFQATGEYSRYGRIMNINSILLCAVIFVLIFVLKTDNYVHYLIAYAFIYYVIWILLELWVSRDIKINSRGAFRFDKNELIFNVKEGLPLTLGNLSSTLFASLDRWFVKFLLTVNDFAYYSFAVSMETFLNIAISPVTITFYNYICKHKDGASMRRLKRYVVIFAVFIVSAVFPAKIILELFIKKYIDSAIVLFPLFAAKIFNIVIQGYYVNLYKAFKKQKNYLLKMILSIAISFVLNVICYFVFHSNFGFAIGTLIAMVIWLVLCEMDFKEYSLNIKEFCYIVIAAIMLVIFGGYINPIIGFVIYVTCMGLMTALLFKEETKYFLSSVMRRLKK